MAHPYCVSRKPISTMTRPASCERVGTSPSAIKPSSSTNGGTSDGNKTAREAPSKHDGAREQIGRCGTRQRPLDHSLQQIFSKSRSQQIVEPEQQNRHRDEREHAGDRHRPHRRHPPQPHQHAEGGKKSAGRYEQEIAADAMGADGAQCFGSNDAEARDHGEPAGDAACRQRLLQNQPRQQHAAQCRA